MSNKYKLVDLVEVFEVFPASKRIYFLKLENSNVELDNESRNYVVRINGVFYYAYSGDTERADHDWRYEMTKWA